MENNPNNIVVVQSDMRRANIDQLADNLVRDYDNLRSGKLSRNDALAGVAIACAVVRLYEYKERSGEFDEATITDATKQLE